MQKSIEDFKAALSLGGVRPTMYEVTFSIPESLRLNSEVEVYDVLNFSMLTKAASIPSESLTSLSLGLPAGAVLKLPGSRIFEPWSCTVINDGGMRLRGLFETWSDRIIGREAPLREMNESDYLSTLEVTQLDRAGAPVRRYTLHYCYPLTISNQQLSYDSETVSEFTVTWNYHYHTSTDIIED